MIVAIVGPTAVGKTKLSIELAKKYNGIIINCDAVQVYRDLNIGSAKITAEEKEGIPHFLLDVADLNDVYTVYHYQKEVRTLLKKYANRNIIFVGGSGLYLRAALYDYHFDPETKTNEFLEYSNEELYQLALKKDPNCPIHINNRKRLIRFLNQTHSPTNSKPLYPAIYIGLTTDRKVLYQKIDNRVDKMLEQGLMQEVSTLVSKYPHSQVLNTAIGYKELKQYLNKELTYEEAVNQIKQNSRHYAKRQYTFFNHQFPVQWFDVNYDDFAKTIKEVIAYIETKKTSLH